MRSPEQEYMELESLFRTFRGPGDDDDKASAAVVDPRGSGPTSRHSAAAALDETATMRSIETPDSRDPRATIDHTPDPIPESASGSTTRN